MAVKAAVLGGKAKDVALDAAVFEADVKPHLLHETVRAELNAARAGTRGAKSRGLVAGGRSKPWRQKGTGRARQGTIRAPQFTGGGVAFPPTMRSFDVKVNRKARRAALRGALSHHAANGTLAVLDAGSFESPSTKQAKQVLDAWGKDTPVVVVAHEDEVSVVKSFRNLERVLVTVPSELEVAAIVWARALVLTEAALPLVELAAKPPVRDSGPGEGARGNREVPSTKNEGLKEAS
jgi:large subunit ribosomal protein L4